MLSFKLSPSFVADYHGTPPVFGFKDAGGLSVGEVTFLRTYSRKKADGTKETWVDVCERVINGMYSLQKDHARNHRLPWSDAKAAASAKEAFHRLFLLKWSPPGRGLWVMGTPLVHERHNSSPLQNCGMVSTASMTKRDPAKPFRWLMDASMLGVGVGFDQKGADHLFQIHRPAMPPVVSVIPDTREGWFDSVGDLINSYLRHGESAIEFDYSLIRPAGTPIKTFGGTASGPAPLLKLHTMLRTLFQGRDDLLTRTDIADIGNMIGVCVVSGNVRRSAELLIGELGDPEFLSLKDPAKNPVRNSYDPDAPGWGWMSNNSVNVGVDDNLDSLVPHIVRNGEPGVLWMDVAQKFGRLEDAPDYADMRAAGSNPCGEQPLESFETCTLVETYLDRHDSLSDFQRTLKFAYLYAKSVTLLPTHWEETNAIMQRNRRVGISLTGITNFSDTHSMSTLKSWMDSGYQTIKHYDSGYSQWLCVRESMRLTTCKPSGTVSLLSGSSPGVHWTVGGEFFLRAIRFANDDSMLPLLRAAGYKVEAASESPDTTSVAFFPIRSKSRRAEKDVSIFEKASMAASVQRWWSDNAVSVTVSFDAETEARYVGTVLKMFAGQLKSVSFLPQGNDTYQQMPYQQISANDYKAYADVLLPVDLSPVYAGLGAEAIGEQFCSTSSCEVKEIVNAQKVVLNA